MAFFCPPMLSNFKSRDDLAILAARLNVISLPIREIYLLCECIFQHAEKMFTVSFSNASVQRVYPLKALFAASGDRAVEN